ncbi:MAG: dCMP deaminase family protein [Erysipelotrichia bacterium]|nr:dCMP deaminase family protein [Erysipelotrichia bacterium]
MLKSNINWDEYFMGVALLSSLRSKDPNTKVGACIVDDDHKVVSIGYNGMPRNIDESKLSWEKGEDLDSKYLYVCHAEFNAILYIRNGSALKGCTLYVTLFPCNECAKAIIQVGIKEIVYLDNKYEDSLMTRASLKMLTLAGVKIREYQGQNIKISVE